LPVGKIALPGDFASLLVRGDHAGWIVRHRDDEIAPQGRTAIGERQLLLTRIHAPENSAQVAGTSVDLVQYAPLIDDIQEPVLGERRGFKVGVRRRAAERHGVGELEVLDVGFVDSVERTSSVVRRRYGDSSASFAAPCRH
jgi:hypothetical protein